MKVGFSREELSCTTWVVIEVATRSRVSGGSVLITGGGGIG